MTRTVLALLCTLLLVGPAWAYKTGEGVKPFAGKDEKGKTHSLKGYQGKVVVLVVWSSRCPHSKKYGAKLSELARKVSKESDGKVVFLGVAPNSFETASTVTAGKQKTKLSIPVLVDAQGRVAKAFGAVTTPTVYVIDAKGKLAYQGAISKQKPTEVLAAAIKAVRAEKAPPSTNTRGPGFKIRY